MQGNRAQRIGEVVEVRLVEFGVFLVGHVRALALPDRHHGIHGLELRVLLVFRLVVVAGIFGLRQRARLRDLHADGIAHVIAVFLDEVLERVLA